MKFTKQIKNQKAFSLIEVIIAILIITIGLVALSGGLVVGITLPLRSKNQAIAKQLANNILETIISAKETSKTGFDTFSTFNLTTPATTTGRFRGGITSTFLTAGPDGVYGTCDDGQPIPPSGTPLAPCPGSLGTEIETLTVDPGPDGKFSNTITPGDDKVISLINFTRQVEIQDLTPVDTRTRQITVTVTYPNGVSKTGNTQGKDKIVVITQISDFRRL